MRLKSLEIIGFKSFSERVELKFSQGITAIVGPNGCGKSNLLDAIRWALGEQSARLLRGTKMEELMFNGTAQRKALNFAEVSLLLENVDKSIPLDYHEVVITRRMYRSGEGEYYLNKTPCRLKDVLELFWDTGIGTETYSLVGQGRIEQIINARAEDRREIFEEAAEIHKYKQKKKETSSRLEEMRANMVRLEDLLVELKDRQSHLSSAAELAGKYRDFHSQLQQTDRKLFELRWEKNRSSLAQVTGEAARVAEILQAKRVNLHDITEKTARLARDEARTFQEVEEKQKKYQQHLAKVEEYRHKLSLVQEQRKFAREKSVLKEEAFQEIKSRLAGIEKSFLQNKEELQNVLKEQEYTGQKAVEVQTRIKNLRSGSLFASQEKLKEQLAEFRSGEAVMEHSLRDNELRCSELQERIGELENKQKIKWQEAEKWRTKEENVQGNLLRLKNEQADLEKEIQLRQKHYEDISRRYSDKKEKYTLSTQDLAKKNGRLKLLREHEEELTSYTGGVRAVMRAFTRDSLVEGIYGPVASLIDVSPNFEKAVEVALGPSLQFIVVEDDSVARKSIAFLKEKKAGRATFLPLNLLRSPTRKEIPQGIDGFLGLASKVVTVPDKFKKVIDYLLGGVLVARDLESALQLLRSGRGGWRIVTLDGELITPGGAITGGLQSGERSGFLQRKRELAVLQKEIESLEKRLEEEKNALAGENERLTSLNEELSRLDARQKAVEKQIVECQRQMENCRFEAERIAKELTELEQDKKIVEVKYGLLREEGQKIASELGYNRQMTVKLEEELARIGRRVSQEESESKQLEEELMELRVKFSALQEKESSCQEFQRRQFQEKERLLSLARVFSEEREKALAEMKKLEAEEANLAGKLEEEKGELDLEEKILNELSADLKLCREKKEELETEKTREQRAVERYDRRYYQLNLHKTQLMEENRYLTEYCLEKFGLNPATIPHFQVEESEEQLQTERDRLSEQILALGDVNSGAIEEYERLLERIQFLEKQQDDLLQGEKGMRRVMAELDREMEKRFLRAVHSIEENFLETFTGLFGGGQAFIRLTEPDNVLESGIEIVAQPPGKKLQNISLLSGGEKALTAIALLFAVLQYKPAPFCVLDEIDSSLDESNIERFLDFLKKYSQKTQFILITHRQKTMEEADVLYGVTMEEQGISKVLSLNLSEKAG